MFQALTEKELEKTFYQTVDKGFWEYKDAFIKAAMEKEPEEEEEAEEEKPLSEDWMHDQVPPAQLIVGDRYIPVEKMVFDLLGEILSHAAVKTLLGDTFGKQAVAEAAILFAWKAGRYVKKVKSSDRDFYRYLVKNYYSYSRRLNDLFQPGKGGFSMEEAVDAYSRPRVQEEGRAQAACRRKEAEESVKRLAEQGILSPRESGLWQINF